MSSNVSGNFCPSFTGAGLTFTGNPSASNADVYGEGPSSLFGNQSFLVGNGLIDIASQASSNIYAVSFNLGCFGNCGTYPLVLSATSPGLGSSVLFDSSIVYPELFPNCSGNYPWMMSSVQFFGIISTSPLTDVNITSNTVVPNISARRCSLWHPIGHQRYSRSSDPRPHRLRTRCHRSTPTLCPRTR